MDFITENYIWFIVGAVILLMAVIGYYADKTDFGRIKKEKKVKPVKEEIKVEEVVEEPVEKTEEVALEKPKKEKKKKKDKKKKKKETEEQPNEEVDAEELVENNEEKPEEDLFAEFDTMPPVESNEMVDESLFAPLTDEQVVESDEVTENSEENVIEPVSEEIENNNDFELQSVEPTNLPEIDLADSVSPVADEEDVWKF